MSQPLILALAISFERNLQILIMSLTLSFSDRQRRDLVE